MAYEPEIHSGKPSPLNKLPHVVLARCLLPRYIHTILQQHNFGRSGTLPCEEPVRQDASHFGDVRLYGGSANPPGVNGDPNTIQWMSHTATAWGIQFNFATIGVNGMSHTGPTAWGSYMFVFHDAGGVAESGRHDAQPRKGKKREEQWYTTEM
jgi:hypothetical protein